jgi:exodeoxyribonuclease VII small subunit
VEKASKDRKMPEEKKEKDIGKLSFEDAIKELTNIVGQIEQGEIPLADSLEQYEKGMSLIKHCRGILQKAEKRIEKITKEEKPEDNGQ